MLWTSGRTGHQIAETERAMIHDYIASQLIAERQRALAASLKHRAQLKEARAGRRASAAPAQRPARSRWVFFHRSAHTAV
jgi:hypothetical protein